MTGNVVQFPKPDQIIFICSVCKCQSWVIHESGIVECCNCETPATRHATEIGLLPGEWVKRFPDVPATVEKTEAGTVNVKAMGSVSFAMHSTFAGIQQWFTAGELEFIAAYHKDGRGKHWQNIKTEADKEWIIRKLTELLEYTKEIKCD